MSHYHRRAVITYKLWLDDEFITECADERLIASNGAEGREVKSGKAVKRLHDANCAESFGIWEVESNGLDHLPSANQKRF